MKSRKVVVSVTAVFVAAILLAVIFTQACGTGTVDESEKAPEVELQFAMCYERWSSEDMVAEFLYKRMDHFNEANEQGGLIRAVTYSDHQYADKLNALAAANQLPDLFWTIPGVPLNQMAREGLLADLTSYLEEDAVWKESFRPGAFAVSEVDGHIWSIPVLMDFCCLFYNTELFERAGISAEELTTWEGFLKACESLRQNNITPLVAAAKDGSGLMPMAHSLVQRLGGAQQLSSMLEQGAQFDFMQEDFLVAGTMFYELIERGYVNENLGRTAEEMEKVRFVQGKAAMLVADTTSLGSIYREMCIRDRNMRWKMEKPLSAWCGVKRGRKPYLPGFRSMRCVSTCMSSRMGRRFGSTTGKPLQRPSFSLAMWMHASSQPMWRAVLWLSLIHI